MVGRCASMFLVLLFLGFLVCLWVFATPIDPASWIVACLITAATLYVAGMALKEIFGGLGR